MRPDSLLSTAQRLSAAIERRRGPAAALGVDAYRLVNGPGDGAPPGLTLDRYGAWLVLGARESVAGTEVAAWEAAALGLSPAGLVLKRWAKSAKGSTSELRHGPSGPVVRVREGDAVFVCALDEGPQTGLFLDHRETRFLSRDLAKGVEVLNLFAYTGSFSVHAALGGATRVTSVDVAKRALLHGKENMRASGLDPDQHRWFPDDVLKHLARVAGQKYGLVILDPPLVGHAKGARFTLLEDLGRLVGLALAKLEPGGALILSTHATGLDADRLEAVCRHAAGPRPIAILERLGLPAWDHPVVAAPSADDRGDYLSTLVLRVG